LRTRQDLALRFWEDKLDPRVHLRQSLALLRRVFGPDCFAADRDTVRALPGCFVTDIEQMLAAYRSALSAEAAEERLRWFGAAEERISGDFLEGCVGPGDAAEPWVLSRRAEVRSRAAQMRLAYIEMLLEAGQQPAALEMALRVLQWQPDHQKARRYAQELARQTGDTIFLDGVPAESDLGAVLDHLRARPAYALTLTEAGLFRQLFDAEFESLSEPLRKSLMRLAVFPAPFSPALATAVCRVPKTAIVALGKTPLLAANDGLFSLPELVRRAVWRRTPSRVRRQQQRCLTRVCEAWLIASRGEGGESAAPPFRDRSEAEPFLETVLEHVLRQPPSEGTLRFLLCLPPTLATRAVPYMEEAGCSPTVDPELRCRFGAEAARLLLFQRVFTRAADGYEWLAELPAESHEAAWRAEMSFGAAVARHHAGDSQTAIAHLVRARELHEAHGNAQEVASCLRFLAEIQNHLGHYDEALRSCESALAVRRAVSPRGAAVADALFWRGATLYRLERSAEAAATIEEALAIWQEQRDDTGIGHCLRLLGRLRCAEGRYAEGCAHVEHAILLHERAGDEGSRIAALVALGDARLASGRSLDAEAAFKEALAFYEASQSRDGVDALRARLEAVRASSHA
jgi:tetratricopeptide (TPR) repeat protein